MKPRHMDLVTQSDRHRLWMPIGNPINEVRSRRLRYGYLFGFSPWRDVQNKAILRGQKFCWFLV